MKLRMPIIATAMAMMAMFAVSAPAAAAAPAATQAIPVTGTVPGVGTFGGFVTNLAFSNVKGVLTATGTIKGTVTNALTGTTQAINSVFSTTATATGTCTLLTLNIGAIHLDLLGLVVDLAPVNLVVNAQAGPGNLLGNLLCAVAHLLDNGVPTGALAGLLNNILAQLGL